MTTMIAATGAAKAESMAKTTVATATTTKATTETVNQVSGFFKTEVGMYVRCSNCGVMEPVASDQVPESSPEPVRDTCSHPLEARRPGGTAFLRKIELVEMVPSVVCDNTSKQLSDKAGQFVCSKLEPDALRAAGYAWVEVTFAADFCTACSACVVFGVREFDEKRQTDPAWAQTHHVHDLDTRCLTIFFAK